MTIIKQMEGNIENIRLDEKKSAQKMSELKLPRSESTVRFSTFKKDSGFSWVILTFAFLAQIIIFGLVLCFGIYFVTLLDYFKCSKQEVAVVGSITYGTKCITGLLSSILYRKFGCRFVVMLGGLISALGCFLSYFATDLYFLYVSYGLINGFGLGLAYTPTVGILPDYFDKYRYFATAFVSVGSGIGTLLFQPIFLHLIHTYGWQGSMLINAGFALQIVVCGSVLVSRSVVRGAGVGALVEGGLWREGRFWVHFLDCVLWGGSIYIVFSMSNSLVISHGISRNNSAFLVSLIGMCNVIGRITSSVISHNPRTNRPLFYAVVTLIFSLSIIGCSFSRRMEWFATFLGMFGLFFGAMLAQLPATIMDLFGVQRLVNVLGYSMCAVGLGGVLIPPLAGMLADDYGTETAFYLAFTCGIVASFFCFLNVGLKYREKQREAEISLSLADI